MPLRRRTPKQREVIAEARSWHREAIPGARAAMEAGLLSEAEFERLRTAKIPEQFADASEVIGLAHRREQAGVTVPRETVPWEEKGAWEQWRIIGELEGQYEEGERLRADALAANDHDVAAHMTAKLGRLRWIIDDMKARAKCLT
jgi:hypothetical protein